MDETTAMKTMSEDDVSPRSPREFAPLDRPAWARAAVTALYVLLVLAAPLIVRFGPEFDVRAAVGTVATPAATSEAGQARPHP